MAFRVAICYLTLLSMWARYIRVLLGLLFDFRGEVVNEKETQD